MQWPRLFLQVVKLLGSNVHLVHKELLSLLQDDALEVRGPNWTKLTLCSDVVLLHYSTSRSASRYITHLVNSQLLLNGWRNVQI